MLVECSVELRDSATSDGRRELNFLDSAKSYFSIHLTEQGYSGKLVSSTGDCSFRYTGTS